MSLRRILENYLSQDPVSFHMPGHKHGRDIFHGVDLTTLDWTEVDELDNLHDAHGAIAMLEERLSSFWGSFATKLSVGGSTACNLAGILGSAPRGSKVLIDRNAHRSVYNAIRMAELRAEYFYPLTTSKEEWTEFLRRHDDAVLVLWTYPTYEGICFDLVDQIAQCRSELPHAVTMVDEAHGAHLVLSDSLPTDALRCGADVVVQSLHKTLPALTMTSVLHFSREFSSRKPLRFESIRERIDWYLAAIQSSSPSYILMCSVEEMMDVLEGGFVSVDRWLEELAYLRSELDRRGLLLSVPGSRFDPSKILMRCSPQQVSILAREYGIRFELATDSYALLMVSPSNRRSDSERLLRAMDALAEFPAPGGGSQLAFSHCRMKPPLRRLESWELIGKPSERVPLRQALGKIAAQSVIPYPPGIPVVVAGEVFGEDEIAFLERCGYTDCVIIS
ncbi:MAG: hypothetical protein Q4A52_04760 [Bacillota bacterium]|nr:hypothetical protein [Bacillota bacterium]